jgi:hypothetical protein
MEMEQMMKHLLAKIDARMGANMKAMQEKADANLKELKGNINTHKTKANINLREMMEEMMNANQAKTKANLKEIREEIKSGQAEMSLIVNAWITNMRGDRKETMFCQVMTEACLDSKELNPEDIKSKVEHWEVPMEDAAVKSLGAMKKQHGLASNCRAMWRAKGTGLRKLWIPEEVCCCLQEGAPLCSSGTAQGKRLQEISDPGKLWTAEGNGRCTARGTQSQEM